ncbi:hypothetical protein K0U00_24850 [Paenibacillus sepulcri]|uniref:Uncharacterized protein n=1 Tax=Paenibacillus sepulcri TaxID=359917 RepID=A0ABS7C8M7_9BACL|nr:hypothetical protein [Paenibacillus sepulcri]
MVLFAGLRKQHKKYNGKIEKRVDFFFPVSYLIDIVRPKQGALFLCLFRFFIMPQQTREAPMLKSFPSA